MGFRIAGSGITNTVVYQPGGVAGGNTYTTWATAYAALSLIAGTRILVYDDSIVSPCVVPAPASGSYAMEDVKWSGSQRDAGTTSVSIDDGVSFTGLLTFTNNLFVLSNATASPCALAHNDKISISDTCDISCASGAAPMFTGAALGAGEYIALDMWNYSWLAQVVPNQAVITMPAAAAVTIYSQVGENCVIGSGAISGHALSTLSIISLSTSTFILGQSTMLGTVSETVRAYPRYHMHPGTGEAAATANQGHKYAGYYLRLDATAATFTQGMPEIKHVGTNWDYTSGRTCIISETSGINGVTMDGYNAETIDGGATFFLPPGATAMFVSDGVSNWTSMGISSSVAGVSGDFVFRPGGVANPQQRIFTTWPTLMGALDAVDGPRTIAFDDSITSPCTPTDGEWAMANVTWKGGRYTGASVGVVIPEGVTFTGLRSFTDNLRVLCTATVTVPCQDLSDYDVIDIRRSSDVSTSGGVAFFSGAALSAGDFIAVVLEEAGSLAHNNSPGDVFDMSVSGTILYFSFGRNCTVHHDAISGAVGTVVMYQHNTPSSFLGNLQTNWLGSVSYVNNAAGHYNLNPATGVAPATANITNAAVGDVNRLDCSAGTFTQTLPKIGGPGTFVTQGSCIVVKETSKISPLTVDGNGADTIDGSASYSVPAGGAVTLVSDGVSDWIVTATT